MEIALTKRKRYIRICCCHIAAILNICNLVNYAMGRTASAYKITFENCLKYYSTLEILVKLVKRITILITVNLDLTLTLKIW